MKQLILIFATTLLLSSCIVIKEPKRPERKKSQSMEQYHKQLQNHYEKVQKYNERKK